MTTGGSKCSCPLIMTFRTVFNWLWFDLRTGSWDLVVNRFAASSLVPRLARYMIYRVVGLSTHSPALAPGLYFQSNRTTIGRRSFVNRGTKFFTGASPVVIGERVQVAMGVTFLTDTHAIGGPEQRCDWRVTTAPVNIGDGCWIGANVTVLPGVTIGTGCVVAAGAVVHRNCSPNGLYAGVPARRIRDL